MKLLFIGMGSIGKRHLKNCIALGYYDVYIFSGSFADYALVSKERCFEDLNKALSAHIYDVVFINTPTSTHIDILNQLVGTSHKCIYMEKPVSHNIENIDLELLSSFRTKGAMLVGYDLRFDPGLNKCIEWIEKGKIGKVLAFNAFVGSYLPDWRPNIDYRQSMSTQKKSGGGVMLDLAHEFDYLYYLFGEVNRLSCFYQKTGSLEIETEDLAHLIIEFKSGVSGALSLDYLQREYTRYCRVTGSEGSILWEYASNRVTLFKGDNLGDFFDYNYYSRDDRFKAILGCVLNKTFTDKRLVGLDDALYSLNMILKAKQSSETSSVIQF
jgi:predicted dehydrogenase